MASIEEIRQLAADIVAQRKGLQRSGPSLSLPLFLEM
jgi:hypothetical protein